MKIVLVVTGSRHAVQAHRRPIELCLQRQVAGATEVTLFHGDGPGQPGTDRLAGSIATILYWKVVPVPADFREFGPKAGPIRNRQMLEKAHAYAAEQKAGLTVVAFPIQNLANKGTRDTVNAAWDMWIGTRTYWLGQP